MPAATSRANGKKSSIRARVEHVFTHFRLLLDVFEVRKEIAESAIVSGQPEYVPELESGTAGFPSVFRKALNCYLSPA